MRRSDPSRPVSRPVDRAFHVPLARNSEETAKPLALQVRRRHIKIKIHTKRAHQADHFSDLGPRRPSHRENRAAQALVPPFRLMD
jgi:hypothetical protein